MARETPILILLTLNLESTQRHQKKNCPTKDLHYSDQKLLCSSGTTALLTSFLVTHRAFLASERQLLEINVLKDAVELVPHLLGNEAKRDRAPLGFLTNY